MYNLDQILTLLSKYGLRIAFVIYILFAIILIRQAQLMSRTIIVGFNKYLILFTVLHLAAAIYFAIIILTTLYK